MIALIHPLIVFIPHHAILVKLKNAKKLISCKKYHVVAFARSNMKQSEVDPTYCKAYCTAGRFADRGRQCECMGDECLNEQARKVRRK